MAVNYVQIMQRAFNTPLMIDPAKAMAVLTGLGPRLVGADIEFSGVHVEDADLAAATLPAHASLIGESLGNRFRERGQRPFAVAGNIAIIEVRGTLVHRGAHIGQSSGVTSYEGLTTQLDAAVGDPAIAAIALEIDSFGGEVAGAFDFADKVRAARAQKPIHAFVAEHALSAGYLIASQADRITVPRTGAVGSIGVVVMHSEMSGKLKKEGIKVNLIHSGAHKVEGNSFEALPDEVRNTIQAEIDSARNLFAETVALGRGARMSAAAALATEAAVFRGKKAVKAGLADEVADPVTAFRTFAQRFSAGTGAPAEDSFNMSAPVNVNADQGGSSMDPQALANQVEALQAQVANLTARAEKAEAVALAIEKAAADAGFTVDKAEDGTVRVAKAAEPEYIVINGTSVEKSSVPAPLLEMVQKQAEELAKMRADKHDLDLAKRGATELPNLGGSDLAKGKLLAAAEGNEEMLTALKMADGAMARHMTEIGSNPQADEGSPEFKLDRMAKAHAAETGIAYEAAYLAVSETPEGRLLKNAAIAGSH